MSTTRCSRCSTVVPETRFCLNCRATLDAVDIPDRNPALTSHLSDVAAEADHESVTFERLRSKHGRYDRPLGAYLFEDERPRFLLAMNELAVDTPDGETWSINPGFRKRGHALVSDRRVVVVSPSDRGDQVGAFPFADVVGVGVESSWLTDALAFELADGSTATLSVAVPGELDAIADRMRELAHSVHSSASRTAGFRRDLDAAVADAADAETALRAAADLFAARDGESGFDRFVAEADSAEELFALLSDSTLVGPSPPRRAAEGAGADEASSGDGVGTAADELVGQLPTTRGVRLDARPLGRNLRRAFREGDPKEAGKWAIGAGIAGFSVAAALPFSTAAGLGAIALGGAATGAYASANPDSAAARIDPLEMAVGARTRGRRWEREGGPGGAAAGNLLGAAEHVFDRTNPPAEYAHWYANVDPEAVLRGAEMGARAADTSPEVGNRTTGALLGGGFGLAYGYSGLDADDGELDELLDEDLRSVLPTEGALDEAENGVGDEAFVESDAEPAVENDDGDATDGEGDDADDSENGGTEDDAASPSEDGE